MKSRPTIALLHPYWDLWEHTAGPDFRAERLALVRTLAASLADTFEVALVDDVASLEEGTALGARLHDQSLDAVVVVSTMAAAPAFVLAALDAVPTVPVIVWAAHETGMVGGDFDHGSITTQGATVGAPMITSMLTRSGRPYQLLLGRMDDAAVMARLRASLRLASVASGIRRSRLGRIGRPLPGYSHVDAPDVELHEALGIEFVHVDPNEVVQAWRAVAEGRVTTLEEEVRSSWVIATDVSGGDSLARSLRAALALEDVVDQYDLDGGAFNCHVPQFRFGDEIGIAPCWGLGRLTSDGKPFTCTGDILTAVAMLVTKRLGAAALYHEIETVDYASGEVVIANSGEHDLAWLAPGERPRLGRNGWFCGKDPVCGVCAAFEPAPGPATLVGFTPHPDAVGGFRFVIARGELTERRFPATGTANGAFRFREGSVEEAWAAWASAGVNHHSSATPGDIAADVEVVARALGVEAVVV